jgi:hypothetical protein
LLGLLFFDLGLVLRDLGRERIALGRRLGEGVFWRRFFLLARLYDRRGLVAAGRGLGRRRVFFFVVAAAGRERKRGDREGDGPTAGQVC